MPAGDDLFGETMTVSPPSDVDERVVVSLRIVFPRDVVQTIALERGRELVIGRAAAEVGLCSVPHRTVSRNHVKLEQIAGTWSVRDLASHNGTWCDGVRVGERRSRCARAQCCAWAM